MRKFRMLLFLVFTALVFQTLCFASINKNISPNLYPVKNADDKWGYINSEGKLIIDYMYDHGDFFSEGAAAVSLNGKAGLIGPDGRFIIKPQYDFCSNFSEGFAHIVKQEGGKFKHGFIDKTGKAFFKDYFNNNTGSFHNGLAVFERNGKFGYVDTKGRIVIQPKYACAYDFSEGLAMVADEKEKCGFINKQGKVVIPFKFDHSPVDAYLYQGFSGGAAVVLEKDKYGLINTKGIYLLKPKYDYMNRFSEGLSAVCQNGLWGYIDRSGKYMIKPELSYAASFQNGYAFAKSKDAADKDESAGFGLVDKKGNWITPQNIIFEHGGGYSFNIEWNAGFNNALARIAVISNQQTQYVYIDKAGKIVWQMK